VWLTMTKFLLTIWTTRIVYKHSTGGGLLL
jgi:hypothetical protein